MSQSDTDTITLAELQRRERAAEFARTEAAQRIERNRQAGAAIAINAWVADQQQSVASLVATLAFIAACPACLSESHVLHDPTNPIL